MRILHVVPSVDPAGGGPIEGVKQLGSISVQNGHTVEVASLDGPDSPTLSGFPFPVFPLGPGKLKYGYSPHVAPWLRANASRYDVVVVNGMWQYSGFGTWRSLHDSGVPYVVFTHGMLDPWFKKTYPLKHLKKCLYWPWAEYRVLRDARFVLFTCEQERLLARQSFGMYKAREYVVNYGTAGPPGGDEAGQIKTFYSAFPDLQSKRLCVFMGRIHPKKGCDLAIQSFARVLAKDPEWHLVIAGPDQIGWQKKLVELARKLKIEDRITWTGLVQGNRKWGLLRSAEVMFLPSHQENFGIVVAEALACETPVLISDKVNIWQEITEDGAGFVAPDDAAGSVSLLRQWLGTDPEFRAGMRRAARACFEKRFEIAKANRCLLKILHTAAGKEAEMDAEVEPLMPSV